MTRRRLNIKNLVPRKNASTRQGYYNLLNPSKYLGDPNKIIFRSSWERKFSRYCDVNDRVISWASEPLEIQYINPVDGITKPYNVDFYVKVKNDDQTFDEYIVEVKPSKQLKQPIAPNGMITEKRMIAYTDQMKTYITNLAKFKAAKDYAASRGWKFIIVTEFWLF